MTRVDPPAAAPSVPRATSRRAPPRPAAPPSIAQPAPHDAIRHQAPTYRRALLRCKRYDRREPVRLAFTVRPDGIVDAVAVEGVRAGRVDETCLRESARRFRFAPFSGPPATVTVDYRL